MLIKRVKSVAPWVDLSSYQYPKHGLLAGFEWNFHPKITILSIKKKHPFIYTCLYVKRDKDKKTFSCC